jgi:hypothetical protein
VDKGATVSTVPPSLAVFSVPQPPMPMIAGFIKSEDEYFKRKGEVLKAMRS